MGAASDGGGAAHGHPLRLACATPLHWTGGHEYALVAMRRLLDQGGDAHLNLYGDGPQHEHVQFTIADLGLQTAVTLAGGLKPGRMAPRLRLAEVFLLAAVRDRPWPELQQACAIGLPVVASDLPSVRAAVGPGRAVLVAPRDPAALAQAILALASGPARVSWPPDLVPAAPQER